MDESLLRRLLGAAALLALAFMVATLLPDPGGGGRDDGTVVYDLRTGQQRDGSPLPPVERPPMEKPVEVPPEAPAEPRTAPAEAPVSTPPAAPAGKLAPTADTPAAWFVQVGSFATQANARGALQKLFGMGMPTTIQSVKVDQKLWYRVRVGPYPAEGAATAALARIKQSGFTTAKLVKPDPDAAPKGN